MSRLILSFLMLFFATLMSAGFVALSRTPGKIIVTKAQAMPPAQALTSARTR
jgi:hypothetical protein